jgi:hypothetical protein
MFNKQTSLISLVFSVKPQKFSVGGGRCLEDGFGVLLWSKTKVIFFDLDLDQAEKYLGYIKWFVNIFGFLTGKIDSYRGF